MVCVTMIKANGFGCYSRRIFFSAWEKTGDGAGCGRYCFLVTAEECRRDKWNSTTLVFGSLGFENISLRFQHYVLCEVGVVQEDGTIAQAMLKVLGCMR